MALYAPLRTSSGYFASVLRGGVSYRRVAPCSCLQTYADAGTNASERERITSVQNKLVKHCVKLRTSSKYREAQGRIVLAGLTVLQEQLGTWDPADIEILTLFIADNSTSVPDALISSARKVYMAEEHVMKKLSGVQEVSAVGAVAELSIPKAPTIQQWQSAPRVLVLDRVQDPGNLGTLLRTAQALNWDAVYLLDGCCDIYNEKALRAAKGATFILKVSKGTWTEFHEYAQQSSTLLLAAATEDSVVGAHEPVSCASSDDDPWTVQSTQAAYSSNAAQDRQHAEPKVPSFSEPDVLSLLNELESMKVALVLGSEGQGLRPEVLRDCQKVSIPMVVEAESLNVAAAGSMLMLALSKSLKGVLQSLHGALHT